jgi:hypothetical protein
MGASDLIKALQNPCEERAVHIWKLMLTGETYTAKSAPAALASAV